MFDRDEQEISQIIEVGIEAVLSGESTLEEVLAAHPEQAGVIRPELTAANWLMSKQSEVSARPGFVTASRKRVVARIQQEASNQNAKHGVFGFFAWPQRLAYRWVAALVIVALLLSSTGGLVSASQSALPGDSLYMVKRLTEEITYTITANTSQRIELSLKYAKRRMQEVAALITKKNYEAVLPVLQEFQQQVNQAVAMLQQAANGGSQTPKELKEQKSLAVALKEELKQNADAMEMLQMANIPANVLSGVLDTQAFAQSSLETADAMIAQMNDSLGIPNDTPTSTLLPDATSTPVPGNAGEQSVTPTSSATPEPTDGTDTVVTGEPSDMVGPEILITPSPTDKAGKIIKPGNSSHQTTPPGQLKKDQKPPKDKTKDNNSSSSNSSPPPQAQNDNKPTKDPKK